MKEVAKLSDRVRPGSEAAPWVVSAIHDLESEVARAESKLADAEKKIRDLSLILADRTITEYYRDRERKL